MSDIKLQRKDGKLQIWDTLRSKWVSCTPEERVRQWLINLLTQRGFNPSKMASEVTINVNERNLRADLIVYGTDFQPEMICECKAAHIKIGDATFQQAAMYNAKLKVPYLLITNGETLYCAHVNIDTGEYQLLESFPSIL